MTKHSRKNKKPKSRAANPGRKKAVEEVVEVVSGGGKYKKSEKSIGQRIGERLGGMAGNELQSFLSELIGFGKYKIKRNSITAQAGIGRPTRMPQFLAKDGSVEIAHREFIQDITASPTFSLQSFAINPGVIGTFPYLSWIAQNFEQYDMCGLVFEFVTTSGVAVSGTNTALGTVVMATSYDVDEPPFPDKRTMESTLFVDSGSPFTNLVHPVECDPKVSTLRTYKVRNTYDQIDDLDLFDMGNFQIATVGMQDVNVIGELWVTYHVKFSRPRLGVADRIPSAVIIGASGDTIADNNLFGTEPNLSQYGMHWSYADPGLVGTNPMPAGQGLIILQPGTYYGHVIVEVPSDGGANTMDGLVLSIGGANSVVNYANPPSGSGINTPWLMAAWCMTVADVDTPIQIDVDPSESGTATDFENNWLFITQVDPVVYHTLTGRFSVAEQIPAPPRTSVSKKGPVCKGPFWRCGKSKKAIVASDAKKETSVDDLVTQAVSFNSGLEPDMIRKLLTLKVK